MKIDSLFIFLFLILFPFGQIIRIGILQPIDFIVGLAAVYTIVKKLETPSAMITPSAIKYFGSFVIFASFTWFFSIFIFRQIEVLYGLLYLLRLIAYYFFGIYVWNFVRQSTKNRKLLTNSLLGVSIVSALFGWIQFFMVPDIKALFIYGWDMHLFRLVGTFLDPTFLGLIIVFGLVLSIYRYIDSWSWRNASITIFLLISLAFTYSRASYLAFVVGVLTIIYFRKKYEALQPNGRSIFSQASSGAESLPCRQAGLRSETSSLTAGLRPGVFAKGDKKLILLIVGLMVLVLLLPTAKNHSIELFRTFSAVARVDNYRTTLQIFFKSPVFGVGFNNICIAYQKYIGVQSFTSHACSGSDSSLLLLLTTTGITGFIVFAFSIIKISNSLRKNTNFLLLSSSFLAMLVHSLFSNSLFYPWIMGYLVILLAASLKE